MDVTPPPNPIFCQCTNAECGALLKLSPRYRQGQIVRCPDCCTPFMISSDTTHDSVPPFIPPAFDQQYGYGGYTPEDKYSGGGPSMYLNARREELFPFLSPSGTELDLLNDNVMMDPLMKNMTPLANLPSNKPQAQNVVKSSDQLFQGSDGFDGSSESPTLACKFCNKEFKKAGRLLTHERKHTGERPFSCTECTKSFRDSSALEGHISRQHRTQPFHCTTCAKGFSSQRQLRIHSRVHSGEKPFSCAICSRTFSQEGNLHTHIRRHIANFGLDVLPQGEGADPYRKCKLCHTIIKDEADLKAHVKHHLKANDLHRLREFTPASVWAADNEDNGGGPFRSMSRSSTMSLDMSSDNSDSRRTSIESYSSRMDEVSPTSNRRTSPVPILAQVMGNIPTISLPSPTKKIPDLVHLGAQVDPSNQ